MSSAEQENGDETTAHAHQLTTNAGLIVEVRKASANLAIAKRVTITTLDRCVTRGTKILFQN